MSATPALDQLKNTARIRLPGAGIDALELELFNTMLELCTETGVWRERIERNIVANKQDYDVGPATGNARIMIVMELQVEERWYQPLGADAPSVGGSSGVYEVLDDMTTVRLTPVPSSTSPKALKASITLIPVLQDQGLPEPIIQRHMEAILDGLLGRMMSHVSKPYSNPDQARYHQRRFRAHLTRIRRLTRGGNTKGSPPWSYPTQATGRQQRGARTRGGL